MQAGGGGGGGTDNVAAVVDTCIHNTVTCFPTESRIGQHFLACSSACEPPYYHVRTLAEFLMEFQGYNPPSSVHAPLVTVLSGVPLLCGMESCERTRGVMWTSHCNGADGGTNNVERTWGVKSCDLVFSAPCRTAPSTAGCFAAAP